MEMTHRASEPSRSGGNRRPGGIVAGELVSERAMDFALRLSVPLETTISLISTTKYAEHTLKTALGEQLLCCGRMQVSTAFMAFVKRSRG